MNQRKLPLYSVRSIFVITMLGACMTVTANDYYRTYGTGSGAAVGYNGNFTPSNFSFLQSMPDVGVLKVRVSNASQNASLSATVSSTGEALGVNPCPNYSPGIDRINKCYVIASTDLSQYVNLTYQDPDYSHEPAVMSIDYFPEKPANIQDLDWWQWSYKRNLAPRFDAAMQGFKGEISGAKKTVESYIFGINVANDLADVAMAGLQPKKFIDPDTGAEVLKDPKTGRTVLEYASSWGQPNRS